MSNTLLNSTKYIIVAGVMGSIIFMYMVHKKVPDEEYPILRKIRYSFTLQNTTNSLVKNVKFMAYGPVKKTSIQNTIDIKSSLPYKLEIDKLGNQLLYFNIDKLPPFSTKIISISADIGLTNKPNIEPHNKSSNFLNEEKYIETSSPELIVLAKRFRSKNPSLMAKNINNWVNGHINYSGYIKNDHGALYAYKTKKGDCTEYMYLFTALSRINGLPARGIAGYVYEEDAILKPSDFHNWAEIYIDNAWQVADVQEKKIFVEQYKYIAMRIIAEHTNEKLEPKKTQRFFVWNDSVSVKMN